MKSFYRALFIISLILGTTVLSSADGTQNTEAGNPVNNLKESVLSYFNPVSGTVEVVNNDSTATVRFGAEAVIRKGMRFPVFREGKPFYHPVTNAPLGKTEDLVGRVEVKGEKTDDGSYPCVVIKGDVKAGDIVRLTTSKIKLAFFQDRKSDWALSEAFYGALKTSGRFEILEAYTPSYKPEELAKLAGELGAEAALMFSTPAKDDRQILAVRLYWAEDAKAFAEIQEDVRRDEVKTPASEEFIASTLNSREPWGSYKLAGGQLIAAGDMDNNGVEELIVSDGSNLTVYNLKEDLQELWSIKGSPGEKYLSLDTLDLNNNGAAEIFVTALTDGSGINTGDTKTKDESKIKTFVLEYDPSEGYRKIKDDIPYFMRVLGKTLLMQKSDPNQIFDGPVYEGEWKDGDYRPKRPLNLPPDANIYGFTYIDWQDKGQDQIITFDDKGYLILYDGQGQVIWKSDKAYGAFNFSFERETLSLAHPVKKWFVRGRLFSVRTERGQEVILVNRVPVLSNVPGLGTKGAEVYSLWWNGESMEEKMILSEISGSITDYVMEGRKLFLIGKGGLLSFVKNSASGEFSRGSILYYYNFKEK
ncbi:MAG: VCBS repeat-containing protein [Nitrospirae bacterium]|nr:VCBS repeat-containing protein [Nitrospirota bacterium]